MAFPHDPQSKGLDLGVNHKYWQTGISGVPSVSERQEEVGTLPEQ